MSSYYRLSILMTIALQLTLVTRVHSLTTVNILLEEFRNPGGRLFDGDRQCDPEYKIFGHLDCDTILAWCLEPLDGDNNCEYGQSQSGKYQDRNDIDFVVHDGTLGFSNPLTFHIINWEGGFTFRVTATDSDVSPSGGIMPKIDEVIYQYKQSPARTHAQASWLEESIHGERPYPLTNLKFKIKVYCAENYYGEDCSVLCDITMIERDYMCDPDTGHLVCKPGYSCGGNITPQPNTRSTTAFRTTPKTTTTPASHKSDTVPSQSPSSDNKGTNTGTVIAATVTVCVVVFAVIVIAGFVWYNRNQHGRTRLENGHDETRVMQHDPAEPPDSRRWFWFFYYFRSKPTPPTPALPEHGRRQIGPAVGITGSGERLNSPADEQIVPHNVEALVYEIHN